LTAETKYGGTVRNVKRKRVPGGGSSYSKTTRTEACVDTWDSQQTTVRSLAIGLLPVKIRSWVISLHVKQFMLIVLLLVKINCSCAELPA